VEHPVTEAITGQDLVEWQLKVASGESLPMSQQEFGIHGWAMEARVYAEDVEAGFLPATGTLSVLEFPEDARVDTGVRQGDNISPYYDPMIAKLIVHGDTREQALQRMRHALLSTYTAGATTNLRFLAALCDNASFSSGKVDTGLIERDIESLTEKQSCPLTSTAIAALAACDLKYAGDSLAGFSLWTPLCRHVELQSEYGDERFVVLVYEEGNNRYRLEIDEQSLSVQCLEHSYLIDDEVIVAKVVKHRQQIQVFNDGSCSYTYPDPLAAANQEATGGDIIIAPMPGQIKVLSVKEGDTVHEGDALVVLEAMKMEHTLTAPRDAVVSEVAVALEQQVESGAVLVTFESQE